MPEPYASELVELTDQLAERLASHPLGETAARAAEYARQVQADHAEQRCVDLTDKNLTNAEIDALLWAVRNIPLPRLRTGPFAPREGVVGHGALSTATNKIEAELGARLREGERDQFAEALAGFKSATAHLQWCWEHGEIEPDIFGETYPECMPSFDEFAHEVLGMELRPQDPGVVELPRHDVPALGARVITRHPHGWPDTTFANVDPEQLGTIHAIREDGIDVLMDRHYPGLSDWDNCIQCNATDIDWTDGQMDRLTPVEAAAAIFHRHFTVIA